MAASLVHDVANIEDDQADLLAWVDAPQHLTIKRILESGLEKAA